MGTINTRTVLGGLEKKTKIIKDYNYNRITKSIETEHTERMFRSKIYNEGRCNPLLINSIVSQ